MSAWKHIGWALIGVGATVTIAAFCFPEVPYRVLRWWAGQDGLPEPVLSAIEKARPFFCVVISSQMLTLIGGVLVLIGYSQARRAAVFSRRKPE
jgi:hypothetical protein